MGFGLASRGPRALYSLASFVTGIRGWPRCAVQGSQKSTLDPRLYSLLYIYIYIYIYMSDGFFTLILCPFETRYLPRGFLLVRTSFKRETR